MPAPTCPLLGCNSPTTPCSSCPCTHVGHLVCLCLTSSLLPCVPVCLSACLSDGHVHVGVSPVQPVPSHQRHCHPSSRHSCHRCHSYSYGYSYCCCCWQGQIPPPLFYQLRLPAARHAPTAALPTVPAAPSKAPSRRCCRPRPRRAARVSIHAEGCQQRAQHHQLLQRAHVGPGWGWHPAWGR